MAERLALLSEPDLGRALAAVGARIDFPVSTGLVTAVAQRVSSERGQLRAVSRGKPTRAILRPIVRPASATWWGRVAVAAAAVVVVASGVLVLSPGARKAVADFLGIGGVKITIVPSPLTPSVRPLGEGLLLGEPTTLGAARRRVPWTIRIPTAPDLGTPQVFFGVGFPGGQVSLVYPVGPELPVTRETGVGLLLTEFRASVQEPLKQQPYIQKLVGSGTTIEAITVNGHPGFWLSGAPHEILYIGPNGEPIPDTVRLSGNVLLWQQGDVTFRLESALTKDAAIRIAGSAR